MFLVSVHRFSVHRSGFTLAEVFGAPLTSEPLNHRSTPVLNHLANLNGGQWQWIILIGSRVRQKIDMGKGQSELPQPGDVQLIEPSVQAVHQMTTAIQAVFMRGSE